MSEQALIQPVKVHRELYGDWRHPDLPTFFDSEDSAADEQKANDWVKSQGLESRAVDLESEDDDHPVYVAYFEDGDPDFTAWEPKAPEGDGWFLVSIYDTEDGPRAWFVRRPA